MNIFKKINIKLFSIKHILVLATIFYLFLSVLTYHPDNKQVLFFASIDGVKLIDPWKVGAEKYPNISQFNYPPAHYVVDKVLYFIASPIAGNGYEEWLEAPNDYDRFLPQLSRFAFATKTGLILLAILSGYLVYLVVKQYGDEKQARIATAVWLFNPITVYSIPMMGQNDVIAICFFLMGWLALKNKKILATLMFGIGTSIKMIPIVWVPFLLATVSRKDWMKKLGILIGTGLIYVLTLLPFLQNENFQKSILTGNHNQRFLYAHLPFGFEEAIYVIPLLLMVLLAGLFTHKLTQKNKLQLASFALMAVNMLMLSFTHFHPQWWTWVVLFWAMWVTTIDARKIGAAITVSILSFFSWLLILILFQDIALKLAMLQPLNPGLANLPTIRSFLDARGTNTSQLVKLAYTWLAGVSVLSLGFLYKSNLPDFHEKIVIPEKLQGLFKAVYSNSFLRKGFIATSLMILFLVFSLVAQVVPAPLATKPPDSVRHQELTQEYSIEFVSEYKNLNRFDLYLSDTTLQAKGVYEVKVYLDSQEIHSQIIRGENIGFDSLVRFDVPAHNNINSSEYKISIKPESIIEDDTDPLIMVATTDDQDPQNSLAIRPYYEPTQGLSIVEKAIYTMKNVIKQSPVLFILLGLGILVLA